ncbi:MAG: restriction endonuclease [Bacillota bacterium]|jgi:hypothetical protein
MNLNNLDGQQFEELVGTLLKKMGFITELTSRTGDGGVDIVAYLETPLLKGKYLIQCKRWKGPVGEPVVRDLYGVVLSENANKGIIITNSSFTDKAIKFANGKNIELLDGSVLNKLLSEQDIQNLDREVVNADFIYNTDFERDKFEYIKHRIQMEPSNQNHYDLLRTFYHSYILNNKLEIWESGLLDEYIDFNTEYIKRFCRGSKKKIQGKDAISYFSGYILLLKGDLAKAIEVFRDLGIFNVDYLAILPEYHYDYYSEGFTSEVKQIEGNKNKKAMIINILVLLSHFNFEDEVNHVIKTYKEFEHNRHRSMFSGEAFISNCNLKSVLEVFEDIKNKRRELLYHPNFRWGHDVYFSKDSYINVRDIINRFNLQESDYAKISLLFRL